MTPKEKAEELYDKFLRYVPAEEEFEHEYAKQCALVAVDEIMSFMKNDDEESDTCYWANHPTLTYWQNVKQELDKM